MLIKFSYSPLKAHRLVPAVILVVLLLMFAILPQFLVSYAYREYSVYAEELRLHKLATNLYATSATDTKFGSPAQAAELVVDTGASLTWVRDTRYASVMSSSGHGLGRYIEKYYRSGEYIIGDAHVDWLQVGPSLNISHLPFGLITQTNIVGMEGLLGLSPRFMFQAGTLIDRIRSGRQLRYPTFSWINHADYASLSFGKRPDLRLDWVPCLHERWIVPISIASSIDRNADLSILDKEATDHLVNQASTIQELDALIDTASTHILLPKKVLDEIFASVKNVHFDILKEEWFLADGCEFSDLPDLQVKIGRSVYTLSPKHYTTLDRKLLIAQMASESQHNHFNMNAPYTAILGLPFILNAVREIIFHFKYDPVNQPQKGHVLTYDPQIAFVR